VDKCLISQVLIAFFLHKVIPRCSSHPWAIILNLVRSYQIGMIQERLAWPLHKNVNSPVLCKGHAKLRVINPCISYHKLRCPQHVPTGVMSLRHVLTCTYPCRHLDPHIHLCEVIHAHTFRVKSQTLQPIKQVRPSKSLSRPWAEKS
jgi:hypothetical protein